MNGHINTRSDQRQRRATFAVFGAPMYGRNGTQWAVFTALVVALLALVIAPAVSTQAAASGAVTITTLNVRSGPGTSYTIIDRLGTGTQVTPLRWSGSWVYIEYFNGSRAGWVSGQYVRNQAQVTVTFINTSDYTVWELYLSPSSDAGWGRDVLGSITLDPGERFTVMAGPGVYDILAKDLSGDPISSASSMKIYANKIIYI